MPICMNEINHKSRQKKDVDVAQYEHLDNLPIT
jgi:hypothetical protein